MKNPIFELLDTSHSKSVLNRFTDHRSFDTILGKESYSLFFFINYFNNRHRPTSHASPVTFTVSFKKNKNNTAHLTHRSILMRRTLYKKN